MLPWCAQLLKCPQTNCKPPTRSPRVHLRSGDHICQRFGANSVAAIKLVGDCFKKIQWKNGIHRALCVWSTGLPPAVINQFKCWSSRRLHTSVWWMFHAHNLCLSTKSVPDSKRHMSFSFIFFVCKTCLLLTFNIVQNPRLREHEYVHSLKLSKWSEHFKTPYSALASKHQSPLTPRRQSSLCERIEIILGATFDKAGWLFWHGTQLCVCSRAMIDHLTSSTDHTQGRPVECSLSSIPNFAVHGSQHVLSCACVLFPS